MPRRLAAITLGLSLLWIASRADALPPRPDAPRSASCDIAGEWLGTATDDGGTRWTFPMQLRQSGSVVDVSIQWRGSNGHSGDETARGTIDCATRALELHTVTVTGDLAAGAYHATIAPDLRSLGGRWDGPGVIPGRFTATRR